MKIGSFMALCVLTVAVVIAAVFTVVEQRALTTIPTDRESAFETLAERVNDASAVVLKSNEASFTLVKTETGWGMKDRAQYPVHFDKVKSALVGLAELKLLEAKTSDPTRYKRLEVEDPDKKDAKSVRFEIQDEAGKTLAAGIVGKPNPNLFGDGGGGTYLRRDGEKTSWLAEGEVALGKTRNDWLVREVVNLAAEKVRRAVIRQPDGAEIVVTKGKPEDKKFAIEGIPADRKLKDANEGKNIAGGLWRLTFEDVKPAAEIKFPEKANIAEYETYGGLTVRVEMTTVDDVVWGKFSAAAGNASGEKAEEVKKMAEEINARSTGWVYELSAGEGERLTTKIEDILEKPKGT